MSWEHRGCAPIVALVSAVGMAVCLVASQSVAAMRSAPQVTRLAPAESSLPGYRERVLFRIPVGPGNDAISDVPTGCCGENEEAGTAFVGADGQFYFYDEDRPRLFVIDPSGSHPGRILPAYPDAGLHSRADHGAADSLGNVYLIEQGQPANIGCRVHVLERASGTWRSLTIASTDPRWHRMKLGGVFGGLEIRTRPDGLAVMSSVRNPSEQVLVGRLGRPLDTTLVVIPTYPIELTTESRLDEVDRKLMFTRAREDPRSGRPAPLGRYLGSDRHGISHFLVFGNEQENLVAVDASGERVAAARLPRRPIEKSVRMGLAELLLAPDGGLISLQMTARALVVRRLELER